MGLNSDIEGHDWNALVDPAMPWKTGEFYVPLMDQRVIRGSQIAVANEVYVLRYWRMPPGLNSDVEPHDPRLEFRHVISGQSLDLLGWPYPAKLWRFATDTEVDHALRMFLQSFLAHALKRREEYGYRLPETSDLEAYLDKNGLTWRPEVVDRLLGDRKSLFGLSRTFNRKV